MVHVTLEGSADSENLSVLMNYENFASYMKHFIKSYNMASVLKKTYVTIIR